MLEQDSVACSRCGKDVTNSRSFAFGSPRFPSSAGNGVQPAGAIKCLACSLLHGPMLKRSAIASVVVGTILTLLNQGDLLFSAQWNDSFYWKIPLTYCVPFIVATYGALTNNRR